MEGRQQRGGRGGASGFRPNNPAANAGAKQLVDLGKYLHKDIQVKFAGGKEGTGLPIIIETPTADKAILVKGQLKGFDTLLNLVLDEAEQIFEGTATRDAICN